MMADDGDVPALIAPFLSQAEMRTCSVAEASARDVLFDVPPALEIDGGGEEAEAELVALAAVLAQLEPPRAVEELPICVRASHRIQIHHVPTGSSSSSVQRISTVSGSASGHGDVLWGGAQYAAELLSDDESLRRFVGRHKKDGNGGASVISGLRCLELGAGLGLPSWVAYRRGAHVVASDIGEGERMAALACGAAFNASAGTAAGGAAAVRAHTWGDSADGLLCALGGGGTFELIVVCDCLYIVEAHRALAQSIQACLAPRGVALIAFAHHSEHNRAEVCGFFDVARECGLAAEPFEEKQLPVRCDGMPAWRFYVHAYRLRHADG